MFYKKQQKYQTLCIDCEVDFKKLNRVNKNFNDLISYKPINEEVEDSCPTSTKPILMKWIFMAKANLLLKRNEF